MKVRAAGILIENDSILLIDQDVTSSRSWSLPGGKLEEGETLANCVVREVMEETGLVTRVKRLLYICDSIKDDAHIIHITFEVERIKGELGDIAGKDSSEIRDVKFVAISDLTAYGFGVKFQELAKKGFPSAGSYMGAKINIGL